VGIYVVLMAANAAVWAWALITFHDYPLLLGTALLAYGLGLQSTPTTSRPSTM
jgi:nickel/cobalt transporter (NiCoT) family protein